MNNRRVAATVLAAALVVPALLGAMQLAGWGTGGTGHAEGASGTAGAGRQAGAEQLREFAAGLQSGREHTYTAWYTTASGVVVMHAQEPTRRAYRSAAGLYVAGPDATYLCRTPAGARARCSRAAGTDTVPLSHARALAGVLEGDFYAPELVGAYLSRLAARSPAGVQRSERVVAGQPTRCIAVPEAFTACATASGALAHFEAPEGRLTMTGYQATATADLFALPRGAAISDVDAPG